MQIKGTNETFLYYRSPIQLIINIFFLIFYKNKTQGVDVLHAGLATHYIPSSLLPELQNAIVQTLSLVNSTANPAQLETSLRTVLNQFQSRAPLPPGELPQHFDTISRVFGGGKRSVEEIYEACKAPRSGEFGKKAAEMMIKGSPTSQRIVVEQLHRGASMPLNECLKMEYRLVHHLVSKSESDFHHGVTAMLITRTGAPVWTPPTLNQVSENDIAGLFEALPPEEELQLDSSYMPSKL
jgi:enoyl-CoA hydratase/carnithine racemase